MTLAVIDDIARVAYEAVRTYRACIGEEERPSWADASDEVRERYIDGVKAVLAQPSATPMILHTRWCQRMAEDGWQHGEHENWFERTHPDLLPWGALREDQRTKGRLFRDIVVALMPQPIG